MIKAIFSDLDGTIRMGDLISAEILNLIKKIQNKGVIFSIVSGTNIDIINEIKYFDAINGYAILESGVIILSKQRNNFVKDEIWQKKMDKYKGPLKKIYNKLVSDYIKVHKKSITFAVNFNKYESKNFNKYLNETITAEVYGKWLDFFPREAGKWNAIKYILKKHNINPSDVCAIGNDFNDIQMIKEVGFPCVVKDSPEELKQIIKRKKGYISKFNNLSGGEDILNYLIENKL